MSHFIVVGAGQAGASLTGKLRDLGFDGDITLIGAEDAPPYQRPPLSKKYLLGEMTRERLYLRPESYYQDQNITLRLGQGVSSIDTQRKTLAVGGDTISYDKLALTTGSNPRRLPDAIGGGLQGVFTVRNLADVDAMAGEFREHRHVLVVGGGYIGLEAAAVASTLGLRVTLIEMADRILQRVAAPETSEYFRHLHQSHGVDLREGVGLVRLSGAHHVNAATLSDGSTIEVDFVLVGVGISPATDLATASGLQVENGIMVDATGQTSDPAIWAAGDCVSFPYRGDRIRLESVQNAIDQAETVAGNMLGTQTDYVPKPWFWSDQYDVKLQIAGLNTGYDRVIVRPGDKAGAVSHWYYAGDILLAVDAMNDARNYMIGKRMIEAGKSPAQQAVADPATNMMALMKS